MESLNKYAEVIHKYAKDKGWWEKPRSFGDIISLIHSELSEALEEYRVDDNPTKVYYSENNKPEGVTVELADALIRILDYLGSLNIDIDALVKEKLEFNRTRPHRHGNKNL